MFLGKFAGQPVQARLGGPGEAYSQVDQTGGGKSLRTYPSSDGHGDLGVDELAAEFPNAERQTVDAMVAELVTRASSSPFSDRR